MNKYQEILNYFSDGNNLYYIKRYDLSIRYNYHMGSNSFYAHSFSVEKDHYAITFAIGAPSEDPKDINLTEFTCLFADALAKLFIEIRIEISKYMAGEFD